jgi:sugar lactone lactonase YvrE
MSRKSQPPSNDRARGARRAAAAGLLAGGLGWLAAWAAAPAGKAPAPSTTVPFGHVDVVAGGGSFGDGGRAIDALFVGVGGVAADARSNVYVADSGGNRVRKIDARTGTVSTVAGTGLMFTAAASRLAVEQALRGPAPLALDPEGRYLFVGEIIGRRVQRVDLAAGTMEDVGAPPGGFGEPTGIAWTSSGLLVVDSPRGQVWKRSVAGAWTALLPEGKTLAGGIRTVAEDPSGRVYLGEYFTHRVLRWNPAAGLLETAAGTGEAGRLADGARASQSPLRTPDGIAFDPAGNLVVADKGNHRICRVDAASGRLTTLYESSQPGSEERWTPGPLSFDGRGNLWVGDIRRNRVLRFAPGAAAPVVVAGDGDIGDGGPALAASLAHPGSVTADVAGNLYISDTLHNRVRVVDAESGRIRTLAGTGIPGFNGDHIVATRAFLAYPAKLQVDERGRVYIGDYYNNRVRVVDPESGQIATVAGNGNAGEDGDGGQATAASLLNPHVLLLEGKLLTIASAVSSKLRRIDLASGRIMPVEMGQGIPDSLEFYGMARWQGGLVLAQPRPGAIAVLKDGQLSELLGRPAVSFPQDVAVSPQGALYICETGRNRVVKWNGKELEVVVENLGRPRAIAFDPKGNLLVADTFHNRVLRVRLGPDPGSQVAELRRPLAGPPA